MKNTITRISFIILVLLLTSPYTIASTNFESKHLLAETSIKAQVHTLTQRYFEALLNKQYHKAYSHLSQTLKSYSTQKDWTDTHIRFNEISGELITNELWRINVYVDPPSLSKKGIYVAIDFDRTYLDTPVHCGYLIWFLNKEGVFEITRLDESYIESNAVIRATSSDIKTIRTQFRCKPDNWKD